MIANARMYAVSTEAAALWRGLLGVLIERADLPVEIIEHAEPAPIEELWQRGDMAAVFMCGLPYSLADPRPILIAAPVPSPAEFGGLPQYWSDFVVLEDSAIRQIDDSFGRRIAFTIPTSQSGYAAALTYFMNARVAETQGGQALFSEIIEPRITPLGALTAVLQGAADIAPIDAFALRLLRRFRPDLTERVRVVASTAPTPIPPLVANVPGAGALQAAFLQAHLNPAAVPFMQNLLLARFERPDAAAYDSLRVNQAAASGYWREHRLARTVYPDFEPQFAKLPPAARSAVD
jgi:ABC-type phosphate/phosphonate transport system substrate-binding protein